MVGAAQGFADTPKRRRGPHHLDKAVDPSVCLIPDFLRHFVIGGELVFIVQLIGPEPSSLFRD